VGKNNKRQVHIPQRTCIVCKEKKDKRLLTRIVRTPDSGVIVDPTGKRNGRGAYLCDEVVCWNSAVASRIIDRALRTELSNEERQELLLVRPTDVDS
jgi:predicted RNA-binding protein YlxR (DUF448 family)